MNIVNQTPAPPKTRDPLTFGKWVARTGRMDFICGVPTDAEKAAVLAGYKAAEELAKRRERIARNKSAILDDESRIAELEATIATGEAVVLELDKAAASKAEAALKRVTEAMERAKSRAKAEGA
jgi:hypothetical protein